MGGAAPSKGDGKRVVRVGLSVRKQQIRFGETGTRLDEIRTRRWTPWTRPKQLGFVWTEKRRLRGDCAAVTRRRLGRRPHQLPGAR